MGSLLQGQPINCQANGGSWKLDDLWYKENRKGDFRLDTEEL